MTSREVRDELVRLLEQVQADSGRVMVEICDDTLPFRDLPGFDSLNAEEVASSLQDLIGREISHHRDLFLDGSTQLTIGQMVDHLCERYGILGSTSE